MDGRRDGCRHAGRRAPARCRDAIAGISIDSRTIAPGEAFFAIKGDTPRRPRLRRGGARGRRRPRGGRASDQVAATCRRTRRCSSCPTCSRRSTDLARGRARAQPRPRSSRSPARSARPRPRRRCGSRSARDGETHASVASFNNHWGVPLSLARLPRARALRRVRDRHEPRRRDHAADQAGAPARGDHHHGRAGASRILRLDRGDRRRQGGDLSRARAGRRRGAQPRQRAVRAPQARAAKRRRRAHRRLRRARRAPTRG